MTSKSKTPEELAALEAKSKADAEAATLEAEAKLKAEKEAAEAAEAAADPATLEAEKEEDPPDMSLAGRMQRAQGELDELIAMQNKINKLVAEKTTALDALIAEKSIEDAGGVMSDIQFYLQRAARQRAQKIEKRNQLIGGNADVQELISQLDTRSPIDRRDKSRKIDPRAIKTKTTVPV